MMSRFTNWIILYSFEMRTNSTGHLVGDKGDVSLSDCLVARTNRMCPVGIWTSVSRLRWLCIVVEYCYGVSSHTGSTMTTKNGVVGLVDEARACRIAFLMSPGFCSGFVVHEPLSR